MLLHPLAEDEGDVRWKGRGLSADTTEVSELDRRRNTEKLGDSREQSTRGGKSWEEESDRHRAEVK